MIIGVLIIDPKIPPFVIVNEPLTISSKPSFFSRALTAKLAISASISAKFFLSQSLTNGTNNPSSVETATPIS
ncbi:Uncharacterised protein [Staphylococcus aureus]|nr:Uncharacterised protein [Staphylococcus aureus]